MSSFANVTIGTAANNGSGDSLRVAFSKINQNFANIQNGSANITVSAPVRTVAGRVGNIVLSVNDVGGAASTGYVNALVTAGNVYADQSYDRFATQVYRNISANLAANISAQAETIVNSSYALAPLTGFQANLTAANVNIQNLQANLGTVIVSTVSGIVTKQNTIDANLGTATTNIITLFGNAATQAANINSIAAAVSAHTSQITDVQTTLGTVSTNLGVMVSNAQSQESRITVIQSGLDSLVSNAATQAVGISLLYSELALTNANVTAANINIGRYATLGQLNDNVNVINTSIYNLGIGQALANARISSVSTDLAVVAANLTALSALDTTLNASLSTLGSTLNANINRLDANLGTATTDISSLFGLYSTAAGRIDSTNANIITANTALKAYVDRVTAVNQYTNANVELYLPTSPTIAAVNLAIITSNVRIKSYIDTVTTDWQSNAASQTAEIVSLRANITAANAAIVAVSAGAGFVTYSDLTSNIATVRTLITSNVAAANTVAATANTNMKAYVDDRITAVAYGNTNVATYLTVDPLVSNIVSSITAIRSNISSIYATDNTQGTDINNLRANITAANAAIATIVGAGSTYSNVNVAGYLPTSGVITEIQANIRAANAAIASVTTGTYGNANVATYLANYNGGINFTASPAVITGLGNISSANFTFANGVNILSTIVAGSGTYTNANVVSYLASNPIATLRNTASGTSNVSVTASNGIVTFGIYNLATSVVGNVFAVCSGIVHVNEKLEVTKDSNLIGNVTVGGNVISNNYLFANGVSILSGVVSKTTSSWTVTTGTGTYSFTVPASGTYQLWVDCNIPNGILAYNATATVTNTNVPVVGAQYAWVYNGGGTPIDFTSIPNQFVGTGNTIVRSNTAPSATTNRFDFGINNTSGGNVTVRYGWVAIS